MTREAVLDLLSDNLIDVTFLKEADILFGKHTYNKSTLGTYFIDYSDKDFDFDFDLRDYQEKFISSEYYKIPGHFQWNYYLIFIRSVYNEEEKLRIEKDDIYTRKFVFSPNEIKKYFEYQKSNKTVDADIINVWKEKLKTVDLDEVYSESPYTQAVPRYLANEVIKDLETEPQSFGMNQTLTIKKISHIALKENYRKYPIQRDFELGKVNLIKGVNGSGKTSFLESIELIIAGKSNRDPNFAEDDNCIEANYNNNSLSLDSYSPGNNTKYRERDIAWYSSGYKTGNELFRAFNKYNFYDSDAAYNLSYNSNVDSLSKYLSSIALGSEFNRIQNRLQGFNERLTKENINKKRIIEEEGRRKDNARLTLESIKTSSNPEENFKSYISYATEIIWLKELPKELNDSYSVFEENYQTAQSYINSINQLLDTIKLRNLESWKQNLIKTEKALKACNKNRIKIESIENAIKEKGEINIISNSKLQILESANKFFKDSSSFNLWNLNERINTLSVAVKKAARVIEYSEKITDQSTLQNEIIFSIYKEGLLVKNQELRDKQTQLKRQIENLKINLDKLQGIVSEIKKYGKQYINLNIDANICPLCQTTYTSDELSTRISQIANDIIENVAIDELNIKLLQTEEELSKLGSNTKDIESIEMAISNIYNEPEYSQLSLNEINKIINTTKEKSITDRTEYLQLLQLKQELEDKGFSEDDFNHVKEKLEANFTDIKLIATDKSLFEERFAEVKGDLSNLLLTLKKDRESILELDEEQKKIVHEISPSIDYLEFESHLNYRIELLKKGIDYFKELKKFINWPENQDISDLDQKINKLYKLHEDTKKAISDQKELLLATQIISEADKRIFSLKPECERLEIGLKVINDILVNYNETTVLGNFLESNENEIQEIFENIHTPREFTKILFNSTSNTVLLKRRADNIEVPIFKISTGQRSALALSIFIALNKKLKYGPNLMLFDDPVTYTDDLNVLSFLDYLREIVIHEDRQLFFATANQKLAGLFEKKFAFLGETDFKVFPFER